MNQKLAKLKNDLIKKFPSIKICGTCAEFYGEKEDNSGLWVSGEESYKDGLPIFTFGDSEINNFLEKRGFYFDFYDGGTVMIYEN